MAKLDLVLAGACLGYETSMLKKVEIKLLDAEYPEEVSHEYFSSFGIDVVATLHCPARGFDGDLQLEDVGPHSPLTT